VSQRGVLFTGTLLTMSCIITYPTDSATSFTGSWLDSSDIDIKTSSEPRYTVSDIITTGQFGYVLNLMINPLNHSDSGSYRCLFRVNSLPLPKASIAITVEGM